MASHFPGCLFGECFAGSVAVAKALEGLLFGDGVLVFFGIGVVRDAVAFGAVDNGDEGGYDYSLGWGHSS